MSGFERADTTGDIECCFFVCMIACFVAQRELIGQSKSTARPESVQTSSSEYYAPRLAKE